MIDRASKWLVVLVALFAATAAHPCGLLTHGEVAYRASRYFHSDAYPDYNDWLVRHADALGGGGPFPDWGYAFGYPDESEAAHWAPFFRAASQYVHETYPKPWNEETEELAVFLLSAASHWIADLNWHGLGYSDEGFLNIMQYQEFDGNWPEAHSHGDSGGDVVASVDYDVSVQSNRWYVPTEDLAAIYRKIGFETVTPDVLETYMGLLFLGQHAEAFVDPGFYGNFAGRSTFLAEQFNDYYMGGVDDMAIWATWVWADVIYWMETGDTGRSSGVWAPSTVDPTKGPGSQRGEVQVIYRALAQATETFSIERTQRGVIFSIEPADRSEQAPHARFPAGSIAPRGEPDARSDRSLVVTTSASYSYVGGSLAVGDFNQDGIDDLAVGAPGQGVAGDPSLGAVHIVYGRTDIAGRTAVDLAAGGADFALLGTQEYGRFGWALAKVDLNADGIDDLAVSSPTTGARDLKYFGTIRVFCGDRRTGELSREPAVVIVGDAVEQNLGWRLRGFDVDGDGATDLIASSPFAPGGGYHRGTVWAFTSTAGYVDGEVLAASEAAWTLDGARDWDWFGYETGIADADDGRRMLLVGAPRTDDWNLHSTGTLYGYDLPEDAGPNTASPVFRVRGTGEQDQVGSAFAAGDFAGTGRMYLALAAPSREADGTRRPGAVAVVPLGPLVGDWNWDLLPAVATLRGSGSFARLGWSLAAPDFNADGIDDLVVSSPTGDLDPGDIGEAGGMVLALPGGSGVAAGEWARPTAATAWTIAGDSARAWFGDRIAFPDLNGDGTPDVAVGARRDSSVARLGGRVEVAITPVPVLAGASVDALPRGDRTALTVFGDRFRDQRLGVRLERAKAQLAAVSIVRVSSRELIAVFDVPPGAVPGPCDLVVSTLFGEARLADAMTITGEGDDDGLVDDDEPGDGDGGCGR